MASTKRALGVRLDGLSIDAARSCKTLRGSSLAVLRRVCGLPEELDRLGAVGGS